MRLRDIPLLILLLFTIIYAIAGDPANKTWSAFYFIVNYLTLFFLFIKERSKVNRLIGVSLSLSMLLFIVLKYFTGFEYERHYTIVPLFISVISIYKLERHG